jgi:hypothetical protein
MKLLFALFTLFLMNAPLHAAGSLAEYNGKNRVLVVLAPSVDSPLLQRQRSINTESSKGFSERDLVVVEEQQDGGPLHQKFGVRAGGFGLVLIGKDGHAAFKRSEPITAGELFRLIDAMPMRRDEMRQRQKKD